MYLVMDTFKILKPAEFDVLLDDINETSPYLNLSTMSTSLHFFSAERNSKNCDGKDQKFKTSIQLERIYGQSLL